MNNNRLKLPVFALKNSFAKFHNQTTPGLAPKNPSLGIINKFNQNKQVDWGSAAGLVYNSQTNNKSILSCGHVLAGNNTNNQLNGELSIINFDNTVVGRLCFQLQSNTMDVGYADIDEQDSAPYLPITGFAHVGPDDSSAETMITMHGFMSGTVDGVITDHDASFEFDVNGTMYPMVNLIKITQRIDGVDYSISKPGDSGALIIRTADQVPLGIIIGGTNHYSFAVSLESIFDTCFIEPLKTT